MKVTVELTADQIKAIKLLRDVFGHTVEEVFNQAVAHYFKTLLPSQLRDLQKTDPAASA
jgi:hypothetical protein